MKEYRQLFEFLCELIDIQIKKYKALATFGVGPDARLNARLVFDEVEELFHFANEILNELKNPTENELLGKDKFKNIFNQLRFYVEQEYLRGHAGWLIDENNIHTPVFQRVTQQREQLTKLASLTNINIDFPSHPVTATQRQCEYDSNAIAYKILDLAVKLREKPDMELDEKIPKHAREVLRKHVSTSTSRYYQDNISAPIMDLYKKCDDFIKSHSDFQKSTETLSKEFAKQKEEEHKTALKQLLEHYREINPNSQLFSPEHAWFKVAVNPQDEKKTVLSVRNISLFGGMAVASATAICLLISYFVQTQDENSPNNSIFNFGKF